MCVECGNITSRKSVGEKINTLLIDIFAVVYFACFVACSSIHNAISMYCFGLWM